MTAVPSLILFKKVVNWGLTAQAINFAQSSFMGHRVCFSVPVDLMNEYFTWTRASGEVRPTGRFVAAPTTIANLPTFATAIERCLGTQYTDLDGVAEGLNYSSTALDAVYDMKRSPTIANASWDYSVLPAAAATSAPAATHYGANDLVMAFVLNKCFGFSAFDAYDVVYNLDDGFGMLTSAQLAAAINLSMQEEENLAAACVLPTKPLANQRAGDKKGEVDSMFRSLLSIDPQRFYRDGKQIAGLFESNTDAAASGNWCLTVGDKIEVPIRLFFRAPVTVLSVVDGAKNASSDTPDEVETVFIKGEAASLDAHDPAEAAAADRSNIMAIRLQLVCSAPAIAPPLTRSTSEVAGLPLEIANQSSMIFYKGAHYPLQEALGLSVAGGTAPYSYTFTAGGTYDQNTAGAGITGPPGITLSSAGSFSFDPTGVSAVSGRWRVNVTITDATQSSVTKDIYITVNDTITSVVVPPPPAPTAPNDVTFSQVTSSSLVVGWVGDVGATSYTYTFNGSSLQCYSDDISNKYAIFRGLTGATLYSVVVTAVNAGGSASSSAFNITTASPTVPDIPTNVSAVAGDTQATVAWSVGNSDGGTQITQYTVTSNPGSFTVTTNGSTTTATITGLTNGTPYTFTVVATNIVGDSEPETTPPVTPNFALKLLLRASSYSGTGAWNDESTYSNNATLETGTIAKNVAGNAIVLDGLTNWTFPNVAVGNAWTAAIWYKDTGSGSTSAYILTQIYQGSINLGIDYVNGAFFYVDSWMSGSTFTINNGVWTNIAVTWDGTNMATYINGTLLGTTTPGGASYDSGAAYRIGSSWDASSFVTGEIGEVRIYNKPLSQGQVTANYNASLATFT
jgi:hypothetical protein